MDEMQQAIRALKAGQPVVFPTDTVYGLGVAVRYASSPQVIYDIKHRDAGKPIAWLVGGPEALDEYGADVPREARALAASHWPGALTIIVKASSAVPAAFIPPSGTIGLRMPARAEALRLIEAVGPIATSSANRSGGPDPQTFKGVEADLLDQVAAVVRSPFAGSGTASTVVDCSCGQMVVVRQGEKRVETGCETEEDALGLAAAHRDDSAAGIGGGTEATMAETPIESAEIARDARDARDKAADGAQTQASDVFCVPLDYLSHDGKTRINAQIWTCAAFGDGTRPASEQPKGIVQIVHGMSEYIARYDDFARYLVSRGFVVCGEDHIGHGKSAAGLHEYGHMPAHGGKDILIGDVHTLRRMVSELFAGVPYVLYGHSMGSFIARAYIARHGEGLAGCVLSGTGNVPAALSKTGRTLARTLAAVRGETFRSKLIDGMGAGGYGKQIPNARTPLDWLSTDPAVVDAYIADPLCGFMFTVGGYSTLLDLTAEVVTPECAARVPKNLPVLLVAGDGDPVGDMGKGVQAAAQLLRDAGLEQVDCTLYEGMRHEIHNEVDRARVYDDVARWITDKVSRG